MLSVPASLASAPCAPMTWECCTRVGLLNIVFSSRAVTLSCPVVGAEIVNGR